MDSYLAGFALASGFGMVTTDKAFVTFPGLDLTLLGQDGWGASQPGSIGRCQKQTRIGTAGRRPEDASGTGRLEAGASAARFRKRKNAEAFGWGSGAARAVRSRAVP